MDVKIITPSRGRAKEVSTKNVVKDIILVVPYDEFDEYKEFNSDVEIIRRPKEVMGIARVRQFILEQFEEPFMLDDDLEYVRNFFNGENEPYKIDSPEKVREIIEQTKLLATEMGAKMYGYTHVMRPVNYYPQRPFRTTGFLCASQSGYLKGHGLKENFDIVSADDYYMTLLNIFHNRYMLIDDRYGFISKNFTNVGGLQNVRNVDNLKSDTLKLRELFGDAVALKKANSHKHNLNEGERSLNLPF
jgi:hypothetical protein